MYSVCINCKREMELVKNILLIKKYLHLDAVYGVYSGAIFKCPECETEIAENINDSPNQSTLIKYMEKKEFIEYK